MGDMILILPDYKRQFTVQTDCLKRGMGVTLSRRDEPGNEYPVIYLSKQLAGREQAYKVSELECRALVWAIGKLKPCLYLS